MFIAQVILYLENTSKVFFREINRRNRPESEWLHVENTHEGIIDRAVSAGTI